MEQKNSLGGENAPANVTTVDLSKDASRDQSQDQSKEVSMEARKARLMRQGEFYRVGIVHAKAAIKHGARPETLFHNAVDHAAFAVRSRVDNILRPTGINVATVMPYLVTALGFIRQRGLLKPAIGMVAAAGGLAYYVQQRRNKSMH